MNQSSRLSPTLKKVALIPCGIVIGLLLGALCVQAWDRWHPGPPPITGDDHFGLRQMLDWDRSERGLYLFDETVGYRFKPSYRGLRHKSEDAIHETNSLGLLGLNEIHREDHTRKLLFLGDSVTYGDGLSFESIFSSQLQQNAEDSWKIYNAACPGWNMQQQLDFLEKYLREVEWDLVIVAVCLNDFVEFGWSGSEATGYQWMITESMTTWDRWELASLKSQFKKDETLAPLARQDDATLLAWQSDRVENYLKLHLHPRVESGTLPSLSVIILPTRAQLEALSESANESIVLTPQIEISKFCKDRQIPCFDASDALRQSSRSEVKFLYLDRDQLHLSERGHKLLADKFWIELETLRASSEGAQSVLGLKP